MRNRQQAGFRIQEIQIIPPPRHFHYILGYVSYFALSMNAAHSQTAFALSFSLVFS